MKVAATTSAVNAERRKEQEKSQLHPFDETFDSVNTAESSLLLSDEDENLVVSRVLEEGLETPLDDMKHWSVNDKRHSDSMLLTNIIPDEARSLQDPDDVYCIEATLDGIVLDKESKVAANLCSDKAEDVHARDVNDDSCIEATIGGIETEKTCNRRDAASHYDEEEGFEMDLNEYKKSSMVILLDLQGAEVDTTGKKMRFELDGDRENRKATRNKMLQFLRRKSKGKKSLGCTPQPSVVKMTVQEIKHIDNETESVDGAREKIDEPTRKISGFVVELYDSLKKTVVESYMLCQGTGSCLEEKVLDYADTEFVRDFFDEEGITSTNTKKCEAKGDESRLAEPFSFEVHPLKDANAVPDVAEASKSSRRGARM